MRRILLTDPSGAVAVRDVDVPADAPATIGERVGAYVALTKPRIIELLLVTTVPAMIVAAGAIPDLGLTLATLLGGTLAAGGANAINCYLDRDIDEVMARTRRRPLPSRRVSPRKALLFGCSLGIGSFVVLWTMVNLLAASLALAALLFYVFVYTIAMKRSTPQNIVIGGAAGAAPVLVGWSAVTGTIDLAAILLFAIIFYWTPPHFWALAMRYEREYEAAGVPMMPVVYGRKETARHTLLYSFMLLAACLAFFSVGRMGPLYLGTTLVLNSIFIWWAVKLYRDTVPRVAWGLFRYSIYYLAVLFVAIAADRLIYPLG